MKIEVNINDRIVNYFQKILTYRGLLLIIIFIIFLTTVLAYTMSSNIPHIFEEDTSIIADEVNENFIALQERIDELEKAIILVPIGTIVPYAGDADHIPEGWLLCDGRELKVNPTNEYFPLFEAIMFKWGGTGPIYNLPDLRGRFLRGVNHDATIDEEETDDYVDPDVNSRESLYDNGNTGNNVGSYQGDEIQKHKHALRIASREFNSGLLVGIEMGPYRGDDFSEDMFASGIYDTTGSETRPKNAAVNFIIRYR